MGLDPTEIPSPGQGVTPSPAHTKQRPVPAIQPPFCTCVLAGLVQTGRFTYPYKSAGTTAQVRGPARRLASDLKVPISGLKQLPT